VRRLLLLFTLTCAFAVPGTAASAATVSVGQLGGPGQECGFGERNANTFAAPGYTVPIDGTIIEELQGRRPAGDQGGRLHRRQGDPQARRESERRPGAVTGPKGRRHRRRRHRGQDPPRLTARAGAQAFYSGGFSSRE
jgi:hypothetical protein